MSSNICPGRHGMLFVPPVSPKRVTTPSHNDRASSCAVNGFEQL